MVMPSEEPVLVKAPEAKSEAGKTILCGTGSSHTTRRISNNLTLPRLGATSPAPSAHATRNDRASGSEKTDHLHHKLMQFSAATILEGRALKRKYNNDDSVTVVTDEDGDGQDMIRKKHFKRLHQDSVSVRLDDREHEAPLLQQFRMQKPLELKDLDVTNIEEYSSEGRFSEAFVAIA